MKTQTQFKNASLVSVINSSIVVKDSTGGEHTFVNASVVSVNNGTIIIETEWKPKKGELVKVLGGEIDCYVIFDHIENNAIHVKASKEISGGYCNLNAEFWLYEQTVVKFSPVTPEEQKEFDDFCKSQGKIWNKETLQWEKLRWKPKDGEYYFTIVTSMGNLKIHHYMWTNDHSDKTIYKIGNCFKTKEEAEAKLEQIKKLLLEV